MEDDETNYTPSATGKAESPSEKGLSSAEKEKFEKFQCAVAMCRYFPLVTLLGFCDITEEENIFIFATLLAEEDPDLLLYGIKALPLSQPRHLVHLAHQIAKSHAAAKLITYLEDFALSTWPVEERLSLAKILFHCSPDLFGQSFKSFYLENPLLLHEDVLQMGRENASILGEHSSDYTWLAEETKKELFFLFKASHLRNALQLGMKLETRFELASRLVGIRPRLLAANIDAFTLTEENRIVIAEALYAQNPVVYAAYFYQFELATESVAGRLHEERAMALPPEELSLYYQTISTGVVDKDKPRLSEKEIAVVGPIISDGLGDFFNLLAIAQSIQDSFPGQAVLMSIAVQQKHFLKYKEIFVVPPTISLEVTFSPPEHIVDKNYFLPQVKKRLREAAYVIRLHPHVDRNLFPIEADLMLREPGSPGGLLGLKKEEMGLLLPHYREVSDSLSKITHPWLKSVLHLAASRISEIAKIYFSWEDEENAKNLMAKTLRLMGKVTRPDNDLFVICNKIVSTSYLPMSALAEDFGTIIIMKEGREEHDTLTLSTKSRVLYLASPKRVPHEDMMIVNKQITCPLVACTGDQSFAELIALPGPVIPFYQIREHKKRLYKQYLNIAATLLGGEHPFTHFLSSHYIAPLEELAALLNNSLCGPGAAAVHAHIRTMFNASHKIPALIAEKLHP